MEESKTQLTEQQQREEESVTSLGAPAASGSSARQSAASSRRVSVTAAAAASAASSSTAQTSSLKQAARRLPQYAQSIEALAAALSSPASAPSSSSGPFVSPFSTSQSLYSITPHETSVLFAPFTAAPHTHLTLPALQSLLSAFLSSLRGSLSQRELPITSLPSSAEAEAALAERLLAVLDRDGDGRVDGDDMQLFLQRVDEIIGEQMRRDWKRKVVIARLQEIAGL